MVGRKQVWELTENKQQLTQRMEELREREYQVTLILILIYLLILILGKIIVPVLIIVYCPSRCWSREEVEGAEEEEESKEEQEAQSS